MIKRWGLFLLSIILVFSAFPISALATERYEILKIGDKDKSVQELQDKLKELEFFSGKSTGYFGTVTQQAVIDYQEENSLIVDGKAGPDTLTSIMGDAYKISSDRLVEGEISTDKYYPGDKGDVVSKLQERLKKLEYYDYASITGYYGPVTEQSVKRFQRTNDLTVDGVAGPVTIKLLNSDNAKYFCIYPGDRGSDVEALQSRLGDLGYYIYDKNTGYFGAITTHALKEFQAQNSLTIDGKAGKNTRSILFSDSAPKWDGEDRIKADDESPPTSVSSTEKMLSFANEQLGKKYVYSTEGPSTFDCSGFVYYVLKYMGVSTTRYSAGGFSGVDSWKQISEQASLVPGDLLFFKSDNSSRIGHTGIFIGNGDFIHASTSGGCVKVSSMTSYYDRNFVLARRLF